MHKRQDIRLGQLLIRNRVCTLAQVNEALAQQKELRAQNQNVRLGRLLIRQGLIDEEKLCSALFEMGALNLYCDACRTTFTPTEYRPGANPCPECGSDAAFEDSVEGLARGSSSGHSSRRAVGSRGSRPSGASSAGSDSAASRSSSRRDAASDSSYVGRILGGCDIHEKIASGGMGVVYKATQLNLGRTVAVKILAEDLSNDATFVRRFMLEARAAAQLSHPNVVHINDVGQYHGIYYFVMEFIDGDNLREVLQTEEKLPARRALEIARQVCEALQHAHKRGIIHRDIKPENIMLTSEGVVKLADLGLAKRVDVDAVDSLTHAGSVLGTPFYMPPEQAKDFSKVDCRSDIYSLGVTLYRTISGEVPYRGRTPIEVMIKAIDGKRKRLRERVPGRAGARRGSRRSNDASISGEEVPERG